MKTLTKISMIILLTGLVSGLSYAQDNVRKEYYDNGNVKSVITQECDKYIITHYYENGTKKDQGEYLGVVRNGEFLSWHPNGAIQLVAEYNHGTPDGIWSAYDTDGNKLGNATFQKGKLVSGSLWNEKGNIIAYR